MGKWSKLKETLRSEPVDVTYQERVDAVKREEFWDKKPAELAEDYKALYAQKGELEERVKELNLKLEAIRQLILEWMANQDIQNFKLASGGVLYEIGVPAPKIIDNVKFNAWLKEEYPERYDSLKIHPATLTSLVKEIFEHDGDLPPGIEVNYRTTLGLKGVKSGEKE